MSIHLLTLFSYDHFSFHNDIFYDYFLPILSFMGIYSLLLFSYDHLSFNNIFQTLFFYFHWYYQIPAYGQKND